MLKRIRNCPGYCRTDRRDYSLFYFSPPFSSPLQFSLSIVCQKIIFIFPFLFMVSHLCLSFSLLAFFSQALNRNVRIMLSNRLASLALLWITSFSLIAILRLFQFCRFRMRNLSPPKTTLFQIPEFLLTMCLFLRVLRGGIEGILYFLFYCFRCTTSHLHTNSYDYSFLVFASIFHQFPFV